MTENGALGFGISGSGPSVYALCKGDENAEKVKKLIEKFYSNKNIDFDLHLSAINEKGVKDLMKYFSLNNREHTSNFEDAVVRGLAPDKGLYFPEKL